MALALLASVPVASARQAGSDTAVTVHGFLQAADSGGWHLLLPEPLTAAGHRINVLRVHGDAAGWSRMRDRYVEAVGTVEAPAGAPGEATLQVGRIREAELRGLTRNAVHRSWTQAAIVTLAAIPNGFSWRLPDGGVSGVQPLLIYTIYNHGQTELEFLLPTNDLLCVAVRPKIERDGWRTSLPIPAGFRDRFVIRLGGLYRQFVPIPPDAAPRPGRYVASVTLCGLADYGVETQFDVLTP